MNQNDVLIDAYGRIKETFHSVLDGIAVEAMTFRPDSESNTISWLMWHLTRVQDDHIADVADSEQVWTADGWASKFDLPFDDAAHGYGQSADDVAAVTTGPELLLAYHDAVYARTTEYIATLSAEDLDRIVDERWDPPVTLEARLVSVISDDLQHVGQAAYLKGWALRSQTG